MPETADDTQMAATYPSHEMYESWCTHADDLDVSVSQFIIEMVEAGRKQRQLQDISSLTAQLEKEDFYAWPDYPCPECGNDVWLDGFDDATTVDGEGEYREVRDCGVCEFVAIRRVDPERDKS